MRWHQNGVYPWRNQRRMISNYFKPLLRNLWKSRAITAINIFGLSTGLCSCLLIGVYIKHELSYDDFELKGNRIVRVIMEYGFKGDTETKRGNFTSVRVAPVFKKTFPEIETGVRLYLTSRVVKYKEKIVNEKKFLFADPSFFQVFTFKLLQGDFRTALSSPRQVILTLSTANRYFGSKNPRGQQIVVDSEKEPYVITGVMPDCPDNSQIKFDFLASFSSLGLTGEESTYFNANFTTYFLLKDQQSISSLEAKIAPFMKQEMQGSGAKVNFFLEPFHEVHLYSKYDGFEPAGNIQYIYVLEAVTLLILLIACFTYINLNTARSLERAKEIGIRKVIGAVRSQLFWNFIGESVFLCFLSLLISLVGACTLFGTFNNLTGNNQPLTDLFSPAFIVYLVLITLVIGFLAGCYPALILSNYLPVKVLKGSFKNSDEGRWQRKALIVFQFAISVFLIAATVIIHRQLDYIQTRDLGYDRDRVLVMPIDSKTNVSLLKAQFKENPNVDRVSACRNTPVDIGGGYNVRSSTMPANQQIAITANPIDEDFVKTVGLKIVAGQDLTLQDMKDASTADTSKISFQFILNESAAKLLGWTAREAVGKRMFLDESRPGYVKAVVKDFNFQSLHEEIKPLVLFPQTMWIRNLLVKIEGKNIKETVSFLESKWKLVNPDRPFEYRFLDEDYNALYKSESRMSTLLELFAVIAIALACLGLFGLSSYSASQRIKEIGIRKVLGASIYSVSTLLAVDFLRPVLVAIAVGGPIAWLVMNRWVNDYAYRITVSWWVVGYAGLIVAAIAVVTVWFQAFKASLANPVESLKSE